MTRRRRAEFRDMRRWYHDIAEANELDEVRTWVVWGTGAPPEKAAIPERSRRPGRPGTDLAWTIARDLDPDWARERITPPVERWVVLVDGDEDDVDAYIAENPQARGYAPYLIQADTLAQSIDLMQRVLRGERVEGRGAGFDAGRPR